LKKHVATFGFTALAVISAAPASAQETRSGQIQQERAEKAKALRPYQPSKIEAALYRVEDRYLVERVFNPPRGAFVRFGGLPEGSGLGAGPAYRYSTHAWSFTTTSAISIRGSWEVDTRLAFPRLAEGHVFAEIGGRHRDLPQEDFFGLGQDSLRGARTAYALRESSVDVTGGVVPVKWFQVSGDAEYRTPRLGSGNDKRFPSTELLFSDVTAPGLDAQPDFLRVGGRVAVNYADPAGGTLVGGRYSVSYDRYTDRDLERYSFDRWTVDLQQYVPIVTSARSIVLRARAEGVTPEPGNDVPFYLQPALGGSHSLRGLPVYRLRDRNALLLQAEYRWNVNAFMAGSLFYDAGKVTFDRRDLNFDDLKHDYGFGLRIGFLATLAMRAEVVLGGGEGKVFALRFGDVF